MLTHHTKHEVYQRHKIQDHSQYETRKHEIMNVMKKDTFQKIYQQYHLPAMTVFKNEKENNAISLHINPIGLSTIDIYIDGMKYRMLIDTGAQITSIKMKYTTSFININQTMNAGSIGGSQKELPLFQCRKLTFANIICEQVCMLGIQDQFIPTSIFQKRWLDFDGILGWDILSQIDFELDMMKKQFYVIENCYQFAYQNLFPGIFPLMLVEDDHHNLLTLGIDTGSKISWINEDFFTVNQYLKKTETTMSSVGIHGLEKQQVSILDSFIFYLYKSKITIKNVPTARSDIYEHLHIDGVLGNQIYKDRKIRFINSEGVLLIA